ncbi:MAG: hypothetical protein WCJ04_11835 [Actinomycetes bacterium]
MSLSYAAGARDDADAFMGGTELRVLTDHAGALFAGIETWMDRPGSDPVIGAQILRLDSSEGAWVLDHQFDEDLPPGSGRRSTKRNEGVTALMSVTFNVGADGSRLPTSVPVLLAACRDFLGKASVYQRDPAGGFTEHLLADVRGKATVRSFGFHRDQVTGVERAFAGTLPTGIFSGAYQAGKGLVWDSEPELPSPSAGRPMAFAECDGALHVAIAPAIWRRVDGAAPRWEQVAEYPFVVTTGGSSGMRGLTSIIGPDGNPALLAGLEGANCKMVRFEPANGYRQVTEIDVIADLSTQLSREVKYAIAANNTVTALNATGRQPEHLISIQIHPVPDANANYYVRNATGRYTLKTLPNTSVTPPHTLGTTRTFSVSPFPSDARQVVFVGGYDADNNPSHNTAWVARSTLNLI